MDIPSAMGPAEVPPSDAKSPDKTGPPISETLFELLDATRALSRSVGRSALSGAPGRDINSGLRAVMRTLSRGGTSTIPQLSLRHEVSRQHMRNLVKALALRGYVEIVPNPVHRRSFLVRLSGEGAVALDGRRSRLRDGLETLPTMPSSRRIHDATETIREIATALRAVESSGPS
jgi:DNA-binding MarR family transcriptional regulator